MFKAFNYQTHLNQNYNENGDFCPAVLVQSEAKGLLVERWPAKCNKTSLKQTTYMLHLYFIQFQSE